MRKAKLTGLVLISVLIAMLSGCAELRDLRVQNENQLKQIERLSSELEASKLQLDQLQRKLDAAGSITNVELDALKQKIAALEADVDKKTDLIKSMQESLLLGGGKLPVELSTKLEELASKYDMITYDSARGVLKFESDLTFEKGSDHVTASAEGAVKSLCSIVNSIGAEKFDIIVAGHTDNVPIRKPATKAKHPTNWHLSAHRAISVVSIMVSNNVDPKRLSARGFGEFHPVEENKPNNVGSAKNRRVEIFIVPQGM